MRSEVFAANHTVPARPAGQAGVKLLGRTADAAPVYQIKLPYTICGGAVRADMFGRAAADEFALSLSLDGNSCKELWSEKGSGRHTAKVSLDKALEVHCKRAKYRYFLRVAMRSAGSAPSAGLLSGTPRRQEPRCPRSS